MRAGSWLIVVASLLAPCLASAGTLGDLEVHDQTSGRTLPVHERDGRLYIVGEPSHRYELRIRNHSGGRVLAVVSVDGVNVISGETAAGEQSGYVIDPRDSVAIEGWRKSMDDVAAFYFTPLRDSYAARTGRPDNVGVIGVALFRELAPVPVPCCHTYGRAAPFPEAPAAAEAQGAADSSVARKREELKSESRLGTGHGERESSPVRYVDFRRASPTPDDMLIVYYDSERNLRAQGILPAPYRYAHERPNPFPNGFVPDP
jgi:hypothetical protein